jgi:hypothetical protein
LTWPVVPFARAPGTGAWLRRREGGPESPRVHRRFMSVRLLPPAGTFPHRPCRVEILAGRRSSGSYLVTADLAHDLGHALGFVDDDARPSERTCRDRDVSSKARRILMTLVSGWLACAPRLRARR